MLKDGGYFWIILFLIQINGIASDQGLVGNLVTLYSSLVQAVAFVHLDITGELSHDLRLLTLFRALLF